MGWDVSLSGTVWDGALACQGQCGMGCYPARDSVGWDVSLSGTVWDGTLACQGQCGMGR